MYTFSILSSLANTLIISAIASSSNKVGRNLSFKFIVSTSGNSSMIKSRCILEYYLILSYLIHLANPFLNKSLKSHLFHFLSIFSAFPLPYKQVQYLYHHIMKNKLFLLKLNILVFHHTLQLILHIFELHLQFYLIFDMQMLNQIIYF